MKTSRLFLVLILTFCIIVPCAPAEEAGYLTSGSIAVLGDDYGISLLLPPEYVPRGENEWFAAYYRSEDMIVGVTTTGYADIGEFRAALQEAQIEVLREEYKTVNQISVWLFTPDRATGRCAIAALQSAPGMKIAVLDFLPNPDGGHDGAYYDACVDGVLRWIRRPEDAVAGDIRQFNAYLEQRNDPDTPFAARLVKFGDFGFHSILPISMIQCVNDENGEAAYANDFIKLYIFYYRATYAEYEEYAGINEDNYAMTKMGDGFDMRVYEYIGSDDTEPIDATVLIDAGNGVKIELVFVSRDKSKVDENWYYINLIIASIEKD